jgi:cytochrome c biogenesis protein CcdA
MLNFIFRRFDEKRFNELSQITRKCDATEEERKMVKKELESLLVPFLYSESLLFIFGGAISFILLPTLAGLILEIFNISYFITLGLKIVIYILSIYLIVFGINQIYERFKYKKKMSHNIMAVLLEYLARS